ncbi:MAG: hypothetical protein CBC34_003415 [Hyphomicrobiaceae bacterium TMED74]|nr:hypothetical protein [Filomicrobium sp.]RPG46234.1 MAG: hypothetical protein CBC34_003415 [Hyphomicrobiaceae bacterium TMED74]
MSETETHYRGCRIYKGPDHRGRTQWLVSVPTRLGNIEKACNSFEDGKTMIDEHLSSTTGKSSDLTVPFALVLLLALLVAVFLFFQL